MFSFAIGVLLEKTSGCSSAIPPIMLLMFVLLTAFLTVHHSSAGSKVNDKWNTNQNGSYANNNKFWIHLCISALDQSISLHYPGAKLYRCN